MKSLLSGLEMGSIGFRFTNAASGAVVYMNKNCFVSLTSSNSGVVLHYLNGKNTNDIDTTNIKESIEEMIIRIES